MNALRHPRTWAALVGVLLLQLGWILVVPPFGGIDEHDHALKAAAVARGDFSPRHEVSSSDRAELLEVPESLAKAGETECLVLAYTRFDNCVGTEARHGTVRIASSAARYNPAYYTVVGSLGRWFTGSESLYVMRAGTALLCAFFVVAAFVVTHRSSTSAWPSITLLLTLTPTAVYTSMIVAPNGVEIGAGLLLWCCLLALAGECRGSLSTRTLFALASAASIPLLAVRTLGPLWWCLVTAGGVMVMGTPRALQLLRAPGARTFLSVCAGAGIYGATWFLVARSNGFVNDSPSLGSPWPGMGTQWVLWFFQTIAAAPLRNNFVPTVVYAVALVAMLVFAILGIRLADTRMRMSLLFVVATASVVAIGASAVTYAGSGYAWQGRYFYPFTVGFFVLLGRILDRNRHRLTFSPGVAAVLVGTGLAVMQLYSQLAVRNFEVRVSYTPTLGIWQPPSTLLVGALTIGGAALLTAATMPMILGRHVATSADSSTEQLAPSLAG